MSDWEDAEDWEKKYGRENDLNAFSKWNYIMRIYSLAGTHLKEGADPDLLFALYPVGAVIRLWEKFEPITNHMRTVGKNPQRHQDFEYLYLEAKKRHPDYYTY